MALALYRRYRPDTLDGVIGQDQVTVPLRRALDNGKLIQAYLFSGPRGCGKTSTARILARCINCAKGPTSHPCGECESCKELAAGGQGSIDVVEIDAASHNSVEDARQIRERAQFAPTRDRYKIFIFDEAHMITPQGFNALLKIVEEPPEHVIFIFATTEPEKVLSTIRSRTHHYPFRLVPPEIMGPFLKDVCEKEHMKPEPGVLELAMRAGGGSVRDTLSVLDQLMVGSDSGVMRLADASMLLGFTPAELISGTVDALISRDGNALYSTVEKVVVGGFEPRRFVEDLLAYMRDLLVLSIAGPQAVASLGEEERQENADELKRQAHALGLAQLTRLADQINEALATMAGAVSPRMRLELLIAQLLEIRSAQNAASAPSSQPTSGPVTSAPVASTPHFAPQTAAQPTRGFQPQVSAQQAQVQQQPVQPQQPVQQVQPAPAAQTQPAAQAHPATQAQPQSAAMSNEPPQELWKKAITTVPEDLKKWVNETTIPHVDFQNVKARRFVILTFDTPLSQHAFSLGVVGSEKVPVSFQKHIQSIFGANTFIRPAGAAANGEAVKPVSSLPVEEQKKIKLQIALMGQNKAGENGGFQLMTASQLQASNALKSPRQQTPTAREHEGESGSEEKAQGSEKSDDSSHGDSSDDSHPHHHKKVAVPSPDDKTDPWANQPSRAELLQQQAEEQRKAQEAQAAQQAQATAEARSSWENNTSEQQTAPAANAAEQPQPDQPTPAAQPQRAQMPGLSQGVTSLPLSAQTPAAAAATQSSAPSTPEVAPEEDVYSRDDEQLTQHQTLSIEQVGALFDAKKVTVIPAENGTDSDEKQEAKIVQQ